jgi:hypothetical protein
MQHGRSRTSSREESVKRRQLEARRAPLLRFEDRGPHTYSVQRPAGGRDVVSPLPVPGAPAAAAQSAWAAAARPHTPTAPPVGSGTGSVAAVQPPRARPVVAPIEPLPGRRARASEAPPARFPAASSIRIDPARAAAYPEASEPASAYHDDEGVSGSRAVVAPPALAEVQARIAARAASSLELDLEPAVRRIGWGWWVALCLALTFVVIAAMRAG